MDKQLKKQRKESQTSNEDDLSQELRRLVKHKRQLESQRDKVA